MSTIVLITAGKGYAIPATLKPAASTLPAPVGIGNNFLFVKISADYIITKLTNSTHVNFSQSEHLTFFLYEI